MFRFAVAFALLISSVTLPQLALADTISPELGEQLKHEQELVSASWEAKRSGNNAKRLAVAKKRDQYCTRTFDPLGKCSFSARLELADATWAWGNHAEALAMLKEFEPRYFRAYEEGKLKKPADGRYDSEYAEYYKFGPGAVRGRERVFLLVHISDMCAATGDKMGAERYLQKAEQAYNSDKFLRSGEGREWKDFLRGLRRDDDAILPK